MATFRLALCLAALALIAPVVRSFRADRAIDRELLLLRDEGLLEPLEQDPLFESESMECARSQLAALLERIDERSSMRDGYPFGVPYMLAPAFLTELERGLEQRRDFFQGLDALPDAFWEQDPAQTLPIPRLTQLRGATNVLCARAWMLAREPDGIEAAGRSLSRALAVGRVVDNREFLSLGFRSMVEGIVLNTFEHILRDSDVPSELLLQPLRAELERALEQIHEQEHFKAALASDMRYRMELGPVKFPRSLNPIVWSGLPSRLERRWELLREYRRVTLGDAMTEAVSSPDWLPWAIMAGTQRNRQERIQAIL